MAGEVVLVSVAVVLIVSLGAWTNWRLMRKPVGDGWLATHKFSEMGTGMRAGIIAIAVALILLGSALVAVWVYGATRGLVPRIGVAGIVGLVTGSAYLLRFHGPRGLYQYGKDNGEWHPLVAWSLVVLFFATFLGVFIFLMVTAPSLCGPSGAGRC